MKSVEIESSVFFANSLQIRVVQSVSIVGAASAGLLVADGGAWWSGGAAGLFLLCFISTVLLRLDVRRSSIAFRVGPFTCGVDPRQIALIQTIECEEASFIDIQQFDGRCLLIPCAMFSKNRISLMLTRAEEASNGAHKWP
ncbi:hypothetical protein ABID19_002922 [Mesorhizobium robiniae]|uniref:GPI-GlcNAc transferase complex PIG-H component conserved domain-containing protein n=1 Tax=Mesorhizobium robiniae TaxID=559315 RepID=A0ABV2GNK9_9HYPH